MKKLLLIVLLMHLSANMVFAQENLRLNLEDSSSGRRINEFWNELRNRTRTGFSFGYQQASFFSSSYFNNVNNDVITPKWGIEVDYLINITPVMIDVAYFYSVFDVNSFIYYSDYGDKTTSLQGCEFFASYTPLLPDFGKISQIIVPFIGIGYQTSSLRVKSSDGKSKDESSATIASLGTGSPMWKTGVMLNFGGLFIKGEYKQSLDISQPEALSRWAVSLGFKM
jgi:hypothetical protein